MAEAGHDVVVIERSPFPRYHVGEGVAPSFDVVRSRAEVANAQQAVEAARGDMRIAEGTFNNTLGRDTRLPVRLIEPSELPDVPVTIDQSLTAACPWPVCLRRWKS